MVTNFRVIGILLIALSLIHLGFPKRFNWKVELGSLSLMNRQMMVIHTFFIALTLLLTGVLCVTSAGELAATNLGRKICLGLGIFWTIRLIVQFFGYSSELWKGKTFETIMHFLFALFWAYLSVVFLTAYFV